MKRYLFLVIAILFSIAAHSQFKLYLGLRGGANSMFTFGEFASQAFGGYEALNSSATGWSADAKGEVLFGFKRLRFGYQFLYNFSETLSFAGPGPIFMDNSRNTIYMNYSQTQLFAHYFLLEFAAVDAKRFSLVPGLAFGGYTGFKIDSYTGAKVPLSEDTQDHFSLGVELNAEVKFGQCTFLVTPNYYFFGMADKTNSFWREQVHFFGVDVGLRVNLLRQHKY